MKVGSLVECVLIFKQVYKEEVMPEPGIIYTVREITLHENGDRGLRLEEIVNPPMLYFQGIMEVSFWDKGFREIQPPMSIDIQSLIEQPVEHA